MPTVTPKRYDLYNAQATKHISLVVKIDGVSDLLSSRPLFTRLKFGDPVYYGDPGLVYGGLRKVDGVRDILSIDGSSLSISQKLEPEQGKSSISTITLAFIDKDEFMTQLISPGVLVDEILGKAVTLTLGYQEISYPEDFFTIFRGKITGVTSASGVVTLQISDPNTGRRQEVFYSAKTKLTTRIEYDSVIIQELVYTAMSGVGNAVTIAYIGGRTAGDEVVTVSGSAITIGIQNGVSTANQISSAISNSQPASALIKAEVKSGGNGNAFQSVHGATQLVRDTIVNVDSNSDFHRSVWGPDGTFDPAIRTYLKVEDEFIEYGPSAWLPGSMFGVNGFSGCTRGARGTTAVPHDIDADVQAYIEIKDNAVDMALKLMLSGWAGDWKEGVVINHLIYTPDPAMGDQPRAIILPAKVDAIRDYGLVEGDYISISNSAIGGNNKAVRVVSFGTLMEDVNRIVYVDGDLVKEVDSPAKLSFRSQFDTYPKSCGVRQTPEDVEISEHVALRNTFLGSADYIFQFLLSDAETCKSFIETELMLPCSAYTLTRSGRLSMGLTHPPVADQTLIFLDHDCLLDPQNIKPSRSTNGRKFFNEIDWEYDRNDNGDFVQSSRFLDSESISIVGINCPLTISSRGAKTSLGFANVVERSSRFLLSRYKRGAVTIDVKTNWAVGSKIEAGDIVGIKDDGNLKISNFSTGTRDLGTQLFEVVDRTLDIKSGQVSLKLISGVGSELTDRFGTIAPSSLIVPGSTTAVIVITDSFGAIYPGDEKRKWEAYIGQKVLIHNEAWTVTAEATLTGFDPTNPNKMLVTGLISPPPAGYIVDIINYPNTTSKTDAQIYKTVHGFLTPTVAVVSGTSSTEFTVGSGDIGKFFVGAPVRVHNESFSVDSGSGDIFVTAIDTGSNLVTVDKALGFIPAAGQSVDLIGFPDGGGPYRFL